MKPSNISPIGDRVFIEILDEIQEYKGTIGLLDKAKEKSNFARVISVPKEYNKDSPVQTGDTVIYNKNSGSILVFDKFDREAPEYRLISISDILAKIDDN